MSNRRKHPGRRGRPAGAKNLGLPRTRTEFSACPFCESTRHRYEKARVDVVFDAPMVGPAGRHYSRIVVRQVRCLDCGSLREDRAHEFHAADLAHARKLAAL